VRTNAGLVIESQVTIWLSNDRGANPMLNLGKDTFLGRNCYVGVYQPIILGNNALIGAYSYIISANHCFQSRDVPIRDQGFEGEPVSIGDDAWLGTHVVVLPGVVIGRGAIIGAGSVVNRDVPEFEIWGGAPARFIKNRP
jgi:acetyltransferase-like isoleucine patch superfamily enzyme